MNALTSLLHTLQYHLARLSLKISSTWSLPLLPFAQVDPYTASMQTQPLGNVPQALETRPPAVAAAGAAGAAPRPPNQMARPVTAPYLNGQMPPGGSRPPGPPGPPFKDERESWRRRKVRESAMWTGQ